MALTTPILGISYPQNTDTTNFPSAFLGVATAVDNKILPRFSSTAARDAAITAPVAGQMCVLTISAVNQGLQVYRRGAWAYVNTPDIYAKAADTTRVSTTTLTLDPDMQFTSIAGVRYNCEFVGIYSCSADTVDLNFGVMSVASSLITTSCTAIPVGASSASATQITKSGLSTTASSLQFSAGTINSSVPISVHMQFGLQTPTSGTVGVGWSQTNLSALGLTMHAGSFLRVYRTN